MEYLQDAFHLFLVIRVFLLVSWDLRPLKSVDNYLSSKLIQPLHVNSQIFCSILSPRLESLFSARGRYFSQTDLRAWKATLASPPNMKWDTFQVQFSNSARVIGLCAHGSLLARGRSSACTTYFSV